MVWMIRSVDSGTVQLVHCIFANPFWMVDHPTFCISGKSLILTNFSNRLCSVSQKALVPQTLLMLQQQSPPGFVVDRMLLIDMWARHLLFEPLAEAWTGLQVYKRNNGGATHYRSRASKDDGGKQIYGWKDWARPEIVRTTCRKPEQDCKYTRETMVEQCIIDREHQKAMEENRYMVERSWARPETQVWTSIAAHW